MAKANYETSSVYEYFDMLDAQKVHKQETAKVKHSFQKFLKAAQKAKAEAQLLDELLK